MRRKIRDEKEPQPATLSNLAEAIQTIDQKLSNLEITLPQSPRREYPKYGMDMAATIIQKHVRRFLVQKQFQLLMQSANQLQMYTDPSSPITMMPSPVRFATPDRPRRMQSNAEVQTPTPPEEVAVEITSPEKMSVVISPEGIDERESPEEEIKSAFRSRVNTNKVDVVEQQESLEAETRSVYRSRINTIKPDVIDQQE